MKVNRDASYNVFMNSAEALDWLGTRIKRIRHQPLHPGGRIKLHLFEHATSEERAHPRLRVELPPADDPAPRHILDEVESPHNAQQLHILVEQHLREYAGYLNADDLEPDAGPEGSKHYYRNSIRAQRIAQFFTEARALLDQVSETWEDDERDRARYSLHVFEDEAYAGDVRYDDSDTGTYHSYGHDDPFVHYLEQTLASLPAPGSKPFAVLTAGQRRAVRNQRRQLLRHLDFLMRNKYAYHGITETDIETSLGGFLIDRNSRQIVSEDPGSNETLVPRYELLRIDPKCAHAQAGAWIYRDEDGYKLADHSDVEVKSTDIRRRPVDTEQLTFRRAPKSPHLRKGIRFDWDRNGYVQPGKVQWVSWAGHCDIKAIMESFGLTLAAKPSLYEYRSDTGGIEHYDHTHLLEMLASVMELGSVYRHADESGLLQRGVQRFGGFRNDSRPDRLQFRGLAKGKHFRWPLGGRPDTFTVTEIEFDDGLANMGTAFFHHLPDVDNIRFSPNPRYIKTVEGDYNLIDVTGTRLKVRVEMDGFDADTGYPTTATETIELDMREGSQQTRFLLGTHMHNASSREMYRVYLDLQARRIVAELLRWKQVDGKYQAQVVPEGEVKIPLSEPFHVTLSREMKRDNPEAFQELLRVALREGQNICTDTDMKAEVWNGVVTNIQARKLGENPEERTEHWQLNVQARFGRAFLEYLLRRDPSGIPEAWCPALTESDWGKSIDFLWQDFPDVASKAIEQGEWVVNHTMLERKLVELTYTEDEEGGFFVEDEHIKNVYEQIFSALSGHQWTILHDNKRYGFTDEGAWQAAIRRLDSLRERLSFTGEGADQAWPESRRPAPAEKKSTPESDDSPSSDANSESDTETEAAGDIPGSDADNTESGATSESGTEPDTADSPDSEAVDSPSDSEADAVNPSDSEADADTEVQDSSDAADTNGPSDSEAHASPDSDTDTDSGASSDSDADTESVSSPDSDAANDSQSDA